MAVKSGLVWCCSRRQSSYILPQIANFSNQLKRLSVVSMSFYLRSVIARGICSCNDPIPTLEWYQYGNIPTKSVFNALSNKSTLAIVVVILSDLW